MYQQLKRASMALTLSSVCFLAFAQKTIQGTVKDANGDPMIGVTITDQNGKAGGITDLDGKFTIQNADPNAVLTFSYIGCKPKKVKVGSQKTWNIVLEDDNAALDEVVVVGYGTMRKRDVTGSIASVNSEKIAARGTTNLAESLQGSVPGVNITQSGSRAGAGFNIQVRGQASINKQAQPLYVIDGVVCDNMDFLNPDDIDRIDVLKDASSTAIYGARGANGVVMVQTKTGKAGATQVTFDASFGFSNAYNVPEVMSTKDYANALVQYKGADSDALADYISGANPGIDWMDQLLHTGITQNYKIAVSKGNEQTQTYFSANYMDQEGVVRDTKSRRYAVKLNIHNKLFDWLELTADANLARTENSGVGFGQNQSNPIWIGLNYSPTMEMYTAAGNYNKDPYNCIQENPYGVIHQNQNDRQRNMVTGHVDLKFNILPGLTFTTTNGVDYNDYKWYDMSSAKVLGSTNMSNNNAQVIALQSTNNLTYMGKWGEHNLTATGVWEATRNETRTMNIEGKNVAQEVLGYWNVKNASNRDADNGYSKWTMLSGVARVMYNYADRYMLTGTFRADGSSRFTNKKWGYFPSVAGAWTVSNEKFWEPIRNAVEYMKIRASWGIIGNQNITPYSTLASLNATSFNYGTNTNYTGYWAGGIATPDLTWEKVKQLDFGIDLGFLGNRLSVGIDYFSKKTTDALLQQSSTGYLGGVTYWTNAGEVSNKGFDINVNAQIIQTKDLQWSSSLNASYLKNEVTKLSAQTPRLYGEKPALGTVDPCTIIQEGEAIGTFYGFKWAGLQKNDKGQWVDTYYKSNGTITTDPNASTDRFILGHSNPDFTFGWNNTVTYKNWDFNMFCNAAFGAKRLNIVRYVMNAEVGASMFVTDKDYFDNVGITMPTIGAENKTYGNSDKWLENADYFRCENISIGYTFPRSVLKFADLRLTLSCQNLFTITSYKGMDPAGASFSDKNVDNNNGIDMGVYPNPRTFTFGVRMNF